MDADVHRQRSGEDEAGIVTWEAVFIDSAADADDELRVKVRDYDEGRNYFGPVVWVAHPGPVYPQEGDQALVAQSSSGRWWVITWGAAATPVNTAPPAYVTSLPGSPVDGQEVYYAADAANGVIWHLRYRDAAPGSYKWEFVGGSPLSNEVTAAQTRANAAYGDLATVGPAIALPLAGDYIVDIGASIVNDTAAANTWMSYAIGATAAVDADSIAQVRNANTTVNTRRSDMRSRRKNGLAAVTLTAKYRNDAGTSTFENRWMAVRPVRVG